MSGSLHAIRYEIVILQTMVFEAQGRPIMLLPLPALGKPVRFPVSSARGRSSELQAVDCERLCEDTMPCAAQII